PFDVTITQCTDNFLAGFAMHKYIGRRGRGIVALNSSDADRFLDTFSEWVHLARKARLGRFPITYQVFLPGGPLGREGGILLSEADRDIDMAGYLWRLSRYRLGDFLNPLENLMEFGYYTRLGQSQDLRGAHTAPVSSIVITLYDITIPMNWITLLRKALGFPMSTIEVPEFCEQSSRDIGRRRIAGKAEALFLQRATSHVRGRTLATTGFQRYDRFNWTEKRTQYT
ncbi:hypothetical protein BC629DRAFT_1445453, partial [Irpex lacteus]